MGNTIKSIKLELKDGYYEGKIKITNEQMMFHGYGSMLYKDGSKYKGYYKNNKYHGLGTFVNPYRMMYEGFWNNNELNEGKILHGESIYLGKIKNYSPHGSGKLLFSNKNIYLGNFVRGSISGYGLLYNPDNHQCYTGYWEKNKPIGSGTVLIHDNIGAKKIKVINGKSSKSHITIQECYNPFDNQITENIKENDRLICNICFDGEKTIMFLPCNHISCCMNCSEQLIKCPICNVKIKKKINFFLT